MGMRLVMCTLGDENIGRVLSNPPLIWKVVSPDDPERHDLAAQAEPGLPDLELADGEVIACDLDKFWHGLHYLLTGTAWEGEGPLSLLVSGGADVGDVDLGYGPARAFTAEQVQDVSAALQRIDEATLRARFDPEEMMELEIYPEIWDRAPSQDDVFGYCAEYFSAMKEFIADAAQRRRGLVLHLS